MHQIENNKWNDKDKLIGFTIVFPITIVASKNMVASTLQLFNSINYELNIIITSLIIFMILRCFLKIGLRFSRQGFFIVLSSLTFFFATYLYNKDLLSYKYIQEGLQVFIVYCIPLLILVPLLKDTDQLLNNFYQASYLMGIIAIITFVSIIVFGFETIKSYSMSYGANTMIPAIFLFSKAFKQNKLKNYVFPLILTIAIIILGSRWPLLCIGVFVIYGLLNKIRVKKLSSLLLVLLIAIIFYLIYLNNTKILLNISTYFNKMDMDISSRTINLLIEDNMTYDSGRTTIHRELLSKLNKSPLFGYGAFGGIVALEGELPHSLIFDTWANFGYFLGSLILVYLFYLTMRYYWFNKGSSYSELIVIYACMVWPKVTIGGSFWTLQALWMLISLLLLGKNITKNRSKEY